MQTQTIDQTWITPRAIPSGAVRDDVPRNYAPRVPTHDELRDLWIKQHPNICYGLGEWREYSSGIWQKISSDSVKREISKIVDRAKMLGVRPANSVLTSVMEMARTEVSIDDCRWDSNPDLLPCKNGVLHIPTKTLREHSPTNYLTSALPFDYDENAKAPTWEFVLSRLDADVREFLQEFSGYSLTTSTKYEIALWLVGSRGSGKSTLIEGITNIMGTRAGTLSLANIENSRFCLYSVLGKTLLTATESPSQFIKCVETLNAIISGEPIQIERKHVQPFEIRPHSKIIWAMEKLPRVSSATSGLFRRVRVIEFPSLPESERDPSIKEKISAEGSGILRWSLEGLDRLNARGKFLVPASVRNATAEWERTNDLPRLFIEERCVLGSQYSIKSSTLYDAFKSWAIENGHQAPSSTSVAQDWKRLFGQPKHSNGVYWMGLALKI